MTGLSVDTLRAWERRYEAVVPARGDRGRVYTDRHIGRLKQLAALVASGHAIGSIAGLPDAALRRLRSGDAAAAPGASSALDLQLEPLFAAMQRYDLAAIESQLSRYALLLPPSELVFEVVLPVLRDVGARWQAGTVTPAQEHLASGVIRGVLAGVLRVLPKPIDATRIMFGTPAGERHELGLLCGAVLAAAAGYAVIYLGPDLPAAEIARAARRAAAKAVVLAGTAPGVDYSETAVLRRLPKRITVWIGGAQSTELRHAIGPRARQVASLEELRALLDRHAA